MIKKLLLAIMIALPMSVFAQKFAVINTQQLMESMPEIKTINEQIEAANKKYQDEFSKLQEEMQKKYDEFQGLEETTPQTIKDRRMQEMQELDNKIQQFRQEALNDLQRQQQQLMAPVQEKVVKAIQAIGAEGGYTFVFENVMPLYTGTDVTDITDTVKARLGVK
ncbi:OmpH family outer membrane protein [uncultured Duncaniella sp.]|jgi:outer membrane protein|uniref:OmpH family outer membrane protein n=1 Tax=uncultured Duncaniella sp. TaxID=2768039 RepID=UPI0026752669|nr:OmpH family outer membrane protein [uncultured Duncaniella sp.]MCI9172755.1 OmpH family outer membrane protein [Muribaculaceae bacterium]